MQCGLIYFIATNLFTQTALGRIISLMSLNLLLTKYNVLQIMILTSIKLHCRLINTFTIYCVIVHSNTMLCPYTKIQKDPTESVKKEAIQKFSLLKEAGK